jgi:hypothetical protein
MGGQRTEGSQWQSAHIRTDFALTSWETLVQGAPEPTPILSRHSLTICAEAQTPSVPQECKQLGPLVRPSQVVRHKARPGKVAAVAVTVNPGS